MLRTIAGISLLFFLTGCQGQLSLTQRVDVTSFRLIGHTIFANPPNVACKDIHLDSGMLLGTPVILKGELVSIGEHYSHLIMADDTGRMLVVLTDMLNPEARLGEGDFSSLAVLGTVERGKKGLPYLRARSIRKINS